MTRFDFILASGVALLIAGSAAAQTAGPPANLVGTWKGHNEALVDGPATHHPPDAKGQPAGRYRLRQQQITYKIEGQDGRRFWGTMSSEHQANTRLLGTLSHDGKTIYLVSKEGYLDGQIIDGDTIETCYRHAVPESAVIGCNLMKREK